MDPRTYWRRFRQLPSWAQIGAWILAWPLLGALAIWKAAPAATAARVGAGVVLVVGGVLWVPVLAGDGSDPAADAGLAAPTVTPSPEPTGQDRSPTEASSSPTGTAPQPSPASPSQTATAGEATTGLSPSPSPTARTDSAGTRGDGAPVVVQGLVVDIVDGDTIDLANSTRVRLAITDTPEVHGGIEECGPEASDFTGRFLAGQTVAVYRPVSAPLNDDFGRTVGEVVRVTDGASLNVALVRAGLATIDARFTGEDPDLAGRLRAAATDAATPECASAVAASPGGATDSAQTTESPTDPVGITADHTGRLDGAWTCHPAYEECLPQVSDLDCKEVGHQVVLTGSQDPYRLDGNSTSREDGLGCESYPAWSAAGVYPYY